MKPITLLDHYLEERNDLLRSIHVLLERDPRVKTAWLFGSLGRGDEDALSDIDLWVIVDDNYIDEVITQPHRYTSRIGNPVLFVEAPQNAPEGGAYLMTCYDAKIAPHIVDWYWQPQSLAFLSGQVRLLFDRAGMIYKDLPIQFPGRPARKEILERPIHFISFFWMMLMITAKHAYRTPHGEEMELLYLLIEPITKAQKFLGQGKVLTSEEIPPHRLPIEKIQLLFTLADQMSELMEALSGQGVEVPAFIRPGAYRYMKMIDTMLKA